MQLLDTGTSPHRYGQRSRQRLDLAVLSFFQGFRKVYVGEHVMHASKVWPAAVNARACSHAVASGSNAEKI